MKTGDRVLAMSDSQRCEGVVVREDDYTITIKGGVNNEAPKVFRIPWSSIRWVRNFSEEERIAVRNASPAPSASWNQGPETKGIMDGPA